MVVKTSIGFDIEIEKENLDDMELLDAIAELDKNPLALSSVISLLLGDEQKKKLYAFIKEKEGRAKASVVEQVITEVFHAMGTPAKK